MPASAASCLAASHHAPPFSPPAVLVLDPGVWQRSPRGRGRLVEADVVGRLRDRAAVGHYRGGVVRVAELDVQLVELHRLHSERAQREGAMLGVLR